MIAEGREQKTEDRIELGIIGSLWHEVPVASLRGSPELVEGRQRQSVILKYNSDGEKKAKECKE